MITALHVALTICAVLLLHTWCQGTTFHRSPFQITGNNISTEGLLCFYTGKVHTQPPTPTPPPAILCWHNLPTRLRRSNWSFSSDQLQDLLPCLPPAPLSFSLMPGLFANMRVKVPGQQGLETRWEWDRTPSDRLPNDVNYYFQGMAF